MCSGPSGWGKKKKIKALGNHSIQPAKSWIMNTKRPFRNTTSRSLSRPHNTWHSKRGAGDDRGTCLAPACQLRSPRSSVKPVLTFICLQYVHCVSNLQRQLLLSPGIVVIDCWGKKREKEMREDNIRRGDITGGGRKKRNKAFGSLVALIVCHCDV